MAISIKKKAATASLTETHTNTKTGVVLTDVTKEEKVELPETVKADPETGEIDQGLDAGTGMQIGEAMLAPHCEIGFEASYTHNMGNFESCRLGVSIKIPCLHAEIDEAFDYGKQWVDARLSAVCAELKAE